MKHLVISFFLIALLAVISAQETADAETIETVKPEGDGRPVGKSPVKRGAYYGLGFGYGYGGYGGFGGYYPYYGGYYGGYYPYSYGHGYGYGYGYPYGYGWGGYYW